MAKGMIALVLTFCLVFLQEGLSYYVSCQMLALGMIAYIVFSHLRSVNAIVWGLIAYAVFGLFLAYTASEAPFIVDRASDNIVKTVIGIMGYAFMIVWLPNVRLVQSQRILILLRSVSSSAILILAGLLIVSESNLIPFLTREGLLQQNVRLIDNFSNQEMISSHLGFSALTGQTVRIDLFYGEGSFLAIVLFACLGCFIQSTRFINRLRVGEESIVGRKNHKQHDAIICIGIISLLYVQSFSSLIYGLVIFYFGFLRDRIEWKHLLNVKAVLILTGLIFCFIAFSYEYLVYRLTTLSDSLSFVQRFGLLQNMGVEEFFIGIKNIALMPEAGIHNGMLYIITVSGIGGIFYMAFICQRAYKLSANIKLSLFSLLLVVAIMVQNGGVFSPNKVVLFSLVMLPLACGQSVNTPRQSIAAPGTSRG